jgi:ATP phosphoribosyltransferase
MSALRFGLPNKGSLGDAAYQTLEDAGYSVRRTGRQLRVSDTENNVDFFFLRPRDVAVYVSRGSLDLGVTGRDLLLDSRAEATELLALGFGHSTFHFAGQRALGSSVSELAGKRIATSFPNIVSHYLAGLGVEADLVHLEGAVEISIELGVADVIADVVETGATLEAAGLSIFGEPIMQSEGILVRSSSPPPSDSVTASQIETVLQRIRGVLVARTFVIVDFDCRAEIQEAAFALAPGVESPTVSPLAKDGWVAVRSLIPRKTAQLVMDELWKIGARAILLTSLESTRI